MEATAVTNEVEGDFSVRLRDAGLRVTRPRLLILDLMQTEPGHHSADEIVGLLNQRQSPLPRASVYNVLSALVGSGLINMVSVGSGSTRYEYGARWHHHFVCKVCGVIEDVKCVIGRKPCLEPDLVPGEVDEAQVTFRGTCTTCLAGRPS
jgi:Fur family ferric uptake transcriptional regulator